MLTTTLINTEGYGIDKTQYKALNNRWYTGNFNLQQVL